MGETSNQRQCPRLFSVTATHTTMPANIRLLIADDRTRTRHALRAMLATQAGLEVVGEASDGVEAMAGVERLRPDVVILDVRMPRLDSIAVTAQIKTRWPSIRVVADSLAVESREEVLAAGTDTFVAKGAPTDELLRALQG